MAPLARGLYRPRMDTISQDLYAVTVRSSGGRDGSVTSEDGVIDLAVKAPKELGGPGGATNPEQLFAAGYAACFHSALTLVASRQGVDTSDSAVDATVHLGRDDAKAYAISVDIVVTLPSAGDRESAERIMQLAHQTCPYSRATRGNIEVSVSLAG